MAHLAGWLWPSGVTSLDCQRGLRWPPARRSGGSGHPALPDGRRAGSRDSVARPGSVTRRTGTHRRLLRAAHPSGAAPAPSSRGVDGARMPAGRHPSRSGVGLMDGMAGRRLGRSRGLSLRHRYVTGVGGRAGRRRARPSCQSWPPLLLESGAPAPEPPQFTRHGGSSGCHGAPMVGGEVRRPPPGGQPSPPHPVIPRRVALQRCAPPFGRTALRVHQVAPSSPL
jgi:hypothetical protein